MPVKTLRVEVSQGPDKGEGHVATSQRITIGSSEDNDLVLRDETVSRYHLELENRGSYITVQDLGSTNGTLVGNVSIEKAKVAPGTILKLGKTAVRVEDGEPISQELHDGEVLGNVRGRSPEMRKLMATIARVANLAI